MHWIRDANDIGQLLALLTFVVEHGEVTRDEAAEVLREVTPLINTALLTGTLCLATDERLHPTRAGRDMVALSTQRRDELAAAHLVLRLPFYRQRFLLEMLGSSRSEAEALACARTWLGQVAADPFAAQRQVLQTVSRHFLRGVSQPSAWHWLGTLDDVLVPDQSRRAALAYLSSRSVTVDLYAVIPRLAEPGYDRFGFLDTLECARLYVLVAHALADQVGAVVHTDRLLAELAAFREADLDVEVGWDRLQDYVAFFEALGVYLVMLPGTARSSLLNPVEVTLVPAPNLGRLWRLLGVDPAAPDVQAITAYLKERGVLTHDQAGVGTNRSQLILYRFPPVDAELYPFADWLSEGAPPEKARPVALPRNLLTVETFARLWEDDDHRPAPALVVRGSTWGGLPLYTSDGLRQVAWDDDSERHQALVNYCYQHVPHATVLVSLLLLQHEHCTAFTLRIKRGGRCWAVNESGQKRSLLETLDAALRALDCDVYDEWRTDGRTAMALERALVEWAIESEMAIEEGGVLRIAPAYQESHTGGQRLSWWHEHESTRRRIWEMLSG